eukprot:4976360-Amphidinium_carterae.1
MRLSAASQVLGDSILPKSKLESLGPKEHNRTWTREMPSYAPVEVDVVKLLALVCIPCAEAKMKERLP